MAWDFSTEPEFQQQLDWVEEFCRTEVEPLDLVFPGAAYSRHPKAKALADPLKQQVKDRGLWALFLDKDLGGPGFGQLKLALVNEILGRYPAAPSAPNRAAIAAPMPRLAPVTMATFPSSKPMAVPSRCRAHTESASRTVF